MIKSLNFEHLISKHCQFSLKKNTFYDHVLKFWNTNIYRKENESAMYNIITCPLTGAVENILEKWVLQAAKTRRWALKDSPETK